MKQQSKPLKILAIGDMHGHVPKNAVKIVKREKPDLIINTGDFCKADKIRSIVFRNWNRLALESLSTIVGEKKLNKLILEEIKSSYAPIKFLKSLKIPVYIIYGNNDYTRIDLKSRKLKFKSLEELAFGSNIKSLKKKQVGKYLLIGKSGYFGMNSSQAKWVMEIKSLFKGIRPSQGENVIFITHSPPYKVLDKITWKKSPRYGDNVGDKIFRKYILKYKPALNICAHMHENQGVARLGKTKVLNLGLAKDGLFLIEFSGDSKKQVLIRKIYK